MNRHFRIRMYLRNYELMFNHLGGPHLKWDYKCIASIIPSYREYTGHVNGRTIKMLATGRNGPNMAYFEIYSILGLFQINFEHSYAESPLGGKISRCEKKNQSLLFAVRFSAATTSSNQ